MKTTQTTITTAKSREQVTTWGIWQDRPYPSIDGGGYRARWSNCGGVFPEYGNPAKGLEAKFSAVLLREGYTPETATGNRNDYAGFVPCRETEAIPGAIMFRGRSLGEVSAEIDTRPHGCGVWWKVRGGETPTETEKALLREQVEPVLVAAVDEHAAELRREAVEGIRETCKNAIAEARKALDTLEQEAQAAIAAL